VTDRTQAHRGRQSLLLTNGTPFGAHVYGSLWRAEPIRLVAGRTYTMSAWVRSQAPGIVPLVGGNDWQFRAVAHATGGQWQRIANTFTPGLKDCAFMLRINTESPTCSVWIDDIKLEEGPNATIDPAEAGAEQRTILDYPHQRPVSGRRAWEPGWRLGPAGWGRHLCHSGATGPESGFLGRNSYQYQFSEKPRFCGRPG
jgi:hypothetical protein